MSDKAVPELHGAQVLLLEDDYYLATDLQDALERAGAEVVGPFPDPGQALRQMRQQQPDCALVDVNLGSGPSFELPRELQRCGVPFAFVTGYDRMSIPAEFADVERLEKPVGSRAVASVAARLLTSRVT